MSALEADRLEIERFVLSLFMYADAGTYASLRAFRDDKDGAWGYDRWATVQIDGNGLDPLVDAAYRFADECAQASEKVCFAPPIATFGNSVKADAASLANGLAITGELDSDPMTARQALEMVLGPATIVMESGGLWTNPAGQSIPKLHVHYRLAGPTRTPIEHDFLAECNRLVAQLVGGDPSAVPAVHPLRWAGSVHRKAEPRLARIVAFNPAIEITLADALSRLRAAIESQETGAAGNGTGTHRPSQPQADALDVAAALAVIGNNDLDWERWNTIGLACWRATGGNEAGYAAFAAWSIKSAKFDARTTRARWDHFATSPPDRIGAGTLFHMAQEAFPGWRRPSEQAKTKPASVPEIEAAVKRLAALSRIECELAREDEAKRLGIRVGLLERLVKAERSRGEDELRPGQGGSVELPEVEPWLTPVDLAALLDDLAAALHRYVIVSDAGADATALWLVRSHAHEAFDFNPPLWVKSAVMRSGKTRVCEAAERVAARALLVSSVSASALLRVIEKRPTLILDELDALMNRSPEMREVVRGLFNSSFQRSSARHLMSVPVPGGGYEPRMFGMYAALILAGIGELPETVRDRAIGVEMKRKKRDEKVDPLRLRDGQDLHDLSRKIARWASDHMQELSEARPQMPEWLNDRAADGWEPLFAIADLAGKKWRDRAEAAALALASDETEDASIMVKLLSDLREMFYPEDPQTKKRSKIEVLFTKEILADLHKRDDRPWSEWGKPPKPMTSRHLATLLKPFVKTNQTVRRGKLTDKGYRREDLEDTFQRYLPPITSPSPVSSVTQSQVADPAALGEFLSVTPEQNVTDKNSEKARISVGCDRVTDGNPKSALDERNQPNSDAAAAASPTVREAPVEPVENAGDVGSVIDDLLGDDDARAPKGRDDSQSKRPWRGRL